MLAPFRLGAGLKIGFFSLVLSAMIVACGSISVIEEESLDGSTGSGGAGSGGMKAGASGGSTGAGGGHGGANGGNSGGTGGSSSGTGGSIAGGAGGVGGGGTGGRLGTGGTIAGGVGGVGGGGTGGRLGTGGGGGLGGTSGLGGSGGLGGASGLGGLTGGGLGGAGGLGGGTGTSCAQLQRDFVLALAEAKTCTVSLSNQCTFLTNDRLECGCPTSVTHTDRVDSIRASYYQLGCASGVCPGVLCGYVSGGVCTPGSGAATTCVDQSGVGPV